MNYLNRRQTAALRGAFRALHIVPDMIMLSKAEPSFIELTKPCVKVQRTFYQEGLTIIKVTVPRSLSGRDNITIDVHKPRAHRNVASAIQSINHQDSQSFTHCASKHGVQI
jgi:hypothetical protein